MIYLLLDLAAALFLAIINTSLYIFNFDSYILENGIFFKNTSHRL